MPEQPDRPVRHSRLTTACQHLLALGLICAALTPAANVISLDLAPTQPAPEGEAGAQGNLSAYQQANQVPTRVPTKPVASEVTEYPLTAPANARMKPSALHATSRSRGGGSAQLISTPEAVRGYGSVGVTWAPGSDVGQGDIAVAVRTRTDGAWSTWSVLPHHDQHGPDPDSDEALTSRPGTDPVVVGDVDEVQVRVDTARVAPADLRLAVVDPGEAAKTTEELPELDTGELSRGRTDDDSGDEPTDPGGSTDEETGTDEPEGSLSASKFTPKPVIFSRKQWGANERLRKGSPPYYEVHAGFVHHTVNANNYTKAQVPGIIRGIYAYHTQSRGWSDIGYNFLVDRFGRIWEGRAGGVDRPVVGAHTLGYNEYSFAMSAIGNYETAKPSKATLQAYGALFAWKLSLHGVWAKGTGRKVGPGRFNAINGHRDAGSTACPGRHLYAKLGKIKQLAGDAQASFDGRQLELNIMSGRRPDLIVRRASDSRAMIIPLKKDKGRHFAGKARVTNVTLNSIDRVFNAGDWDRDGRVDMVTRNKSNGALYIRRGVGNGKFGEVKLLGTGFRGVAKLAAVGDVTGDGFPDFMGQPRGSSMRIYPGRGMKGFKSSFVAYGRIRGGSQIGIGRWDHDGAPDTLFRKGSKLTYRSGNGPGGITGGEKSVPLDLKPYDWVVGISDIDLTGHPDLIVRRKSDGNLYLLSATQTRVSAPVLLRSGMKKYNMVG